ncbi:hypothetical protein WICMUC_000587 [Wickerhamomyces mucosus]|uniref:Protein transport protein BOS1 n=1 Tax=Wickerhamomyces mucosus TaxID=1378264 RepID=A0A9P8PZ03_9ASCO|nr:hypothetical protein WICMUC_000587 [Wickerhamomyces mucosus]
MNATYNHALKVIGNIRRDLTEFESNLTSSPLSLQGTISVSLSSLAKTIGDYENFGKHENNEEKIEKFKIRLTNFKKDLSEAKLKFQELKTKREEALQESNRSELLNRRAHSQAQDNPYQDQNHQQQQQQQHRMGYSEGLYKESNILSKGNAQLDEILEMGRASLDELVASNELIRSFQKTLNKSLGTLGVSQETIRTIDKRAFQDKWIFYGSFFLFLVLCYYFLKWFG